jgi:two-component system sensor histidine kinase BarA
MALERAGGNQELARELYQMLQDELPNYLNNIQQHYRSGNHTSLLEVVHKLNGSSTYCGVPALKEAASNLEEQLKQGLEANYTDGIDRLVTEIQRLQQAPKLSL